MPLSCFYTHAYKYEYQHDIYTNIISRINKADEGGTYEYPDSAFEYVYR